MLDVNKIYLFHLVSENGLHSLIKVQSILIDRGTI
jgi:hypothetical protein